jgi:formamidopyrimidine-DNA glycosylase
MPELPEVETIRRDLAPLLIGRLIRGVRVLRDRILVGITPRRLQRRLVGRTVRGLTRRGKVLVWELDDGSALLTHLRMTGQFVPRRGPLPTHTRAVFRFDDGFELLYVDIRCLGTLEYCPPGSAQAAATLRNIGRDALEQASPAEVADLLCASTTPLKARLLAQKPLAGIGNIYASEILWRARLHPDTRACDLTRAEALRLARAIPAVLREAIVNRGSTISDYRTGHGTPGFHQHYLRVYGREGLRCRRRGCPGRIVRMVRNNRSTYLCPVCQASARPRRRRT